MPFKAKRNLDSVDLIKFLLESENQFYNIENFSYDYSTKSILYEGRDFDVKYEAHLFCINSSRKCDWKDFRDAIYVISKMNTPKPTVLQDSITEYVDKWLNDNKLKRVTTLEVIQKAFSSKPFALSHRSLETRIGKSLRSLGWISKRTSSSRFWIHPNFSDEYDK